MKNKTILIIVLLALFVLLAWKLDETKALEETELVTGYIVIEDNIVHFREVEIIESDNKDKMEKFNLTESDLYPTGFVIIDSKEETSYELADKVDYVFTDSYLNFITEVDGDRIYHTNKKEEFLKHLDEYEFNEIPLSEQKIPYFIEINNGKVISITEEFKYTI